MVTTNLFVIVNVKQFWTGGSFRILLPFFRTSWGVGVLNSAIFKLIRKLEWNTKHFPLNLQSGLASSNFRDVGGGSELRNQIRHCKTVCIKRNLYLINYSPMRTQWTTKRNRDAGSSCLCDRGLYRYLRNFGGGGVWTPQPPPRYATVICPRYRKRAQNSRTDVNRDDDDDGPSTFLLKTYLKVFRIQSPYCFPLNAYLLQNL